jgi:hypothetical protein
VDAGDYIVWRKSAGEQGSGLAADGNGNDEVEDGDHVFWQARFGNMLAESEGGAGEAAVPEPCGAVLILAGLSLVSCCRWKLN